MLLQAARDQLQAASSGLQPVFALALCLILLPSPAWQAAQPSLVQRCLEPASPAQQPAHGSPSASSTAQVPASSPAAQPHTQLQGGSRAAQATPASWHRRLHQLEYGWLEEHAHQLPSSLQHKAHQLYRHIGA